MFFCHCNEENSDQIEILRAKPQPCKRHKNKQIIFICKTCSKNSLLCDQCIDEHHGHDWVGLKDFLSQEVMDIFASGKSQNGQLVKETVETLVKLLVQYSNRINETLKDIQEKIAKSLTKLQQQFPLQLGYKLKGNKLTNQSMAIVLQIVKNQNKRYNCAELKRTFKQIIKTSQSAINDNLKGLLQSLQRNRWEVIDEEELFAIENNFVSKFKKQSDNQGFVFSAVEKSPAIRLEHEKRVAIYHRQTPKFPVVLTEKPLSPESFKIRFKIVNMEKTMIFFDLSTVYVGLCIPELAQNFNYSNLCQPSKGAYMISSDGKAFHSKLPEYDNSNSHFTFGKGDIIKIGVDFERGIIFFQKNSSKISMGNRFEMRLSLDSNYIRKLKPCVMFGKECGAEVAILNKNDPYCEGDYRQIESTNGDKKSVREARSVRSQKSGKSISSQRRI